MRSLGLVLLLAGCAAANRPSHFPSRGAFMCLENQTGDVIDFAAEDAFGRQLVIAEKVRPYSRRLVRWPFVARSGRLLAGRRTDGRMFAARLWTQDFQPWDQDYWHWVAVPESTNDLVAAGPCR